MKHLWLIMQSNTCYALFLIIVSVLFGVVRVWLSLSMLLIISMFEMWEMPHI